MGISDDISSAGPNIEAWTVEAIEALSTVNISAATVSTGVIRGTSTTLDIPFNEQHSARARDERQDAEAAAGTAARQQYARRREPMRRDSMKRREALLMGKEGSRQRRRWENDRLLGNPWAVPPLPGDWQVGPTCPVHAVPYYLAPMWDERQAQVKMRQAEQEKHELRGRNPASRVSRELRQKLKRSNAARNLLQDLEDKVRAFVIMWEEKERELQSEDLVDVDSAEEEEVVFVGRNGSMKDVRISKTSEQSLRAEKLVFDSPVDDPGAAFGCVPVASSFVIEFLLSISGAGLYTLLPVTTIYPRGRSPEAIQHGGKLTLASGSQLWVLIIAFIAMDAFLFPFGDWYRRNSSTPATDFSPSLGVVLNLVSI